MTNVVPAMPSNLLWWQQLRWRLILFFILLATVPVLVATYFTLMRMSDQAMQQSLSEVGAIAELKRDQLTRWIDNSQQLLSLFVASSDRGKPFVALLSAQTIESDNIQRRALNEKLSNVTEAQAFFNELFVYNTAGRIILASNERLIQQTVNNQPYFADSLAEPTLVQPPYYHVGRDLIIIVTYRLIDETTGEPVGVIAGRLNLVTLGEIMLETKGLENVGETYLISLENNWLITPTREDEERMQLAHHSEGIDRALQGQDGVDHYPNYAGEPVLGAHLWIDPLQLGLLVEINEAAALKSSRETQNISLIGAIIAAVLAGLAGLYIATQIATPITALTNMATQIAGGNLEQRVSVVQNDEIGLLATNFNQMADQLHDTLAGLEQRVADRTQDLAAANEQLQQETAKREQLQQEIIQAQQNTIRELSTPIIPIMKHIIIMPLIGNIDTQRAREITRSLLLGISQQRAKVVILDITGVPIVDTGVAGYLDKTIQAARLKGARTIVTGMSDAVAETIVDLGIDWSNLQTVRNLQVGLTVAINSLQVDHHSQPPL